MKYTCLSPLNRFRDHIQENLYLLSLRVFSNNSFKYLFGNVDSIIKSSDDIIYVCCQASVIIYLIDFLFTQQTALHYTVTPEPSSPLPTRTPAATQKKQDEWELGVLKGIAWWIIPIQGEFHRHSTLSLT